MSDYVHEKVIRCPINYVIDALNLDIQRASDIENY